MQNLLNFLFRFRTFGFFLFLEGVCAWLIISYNNRPNAAFLNSSNYLVGNINMVTSNTVDYFQLQELNGQLVEENLLLREQLANMNRSGFAFFDTSRVKKYTFLDAKVINSTFRRPMNYLTLNRGSRDGLEPGMGVVSGKGLVGQVKSVSDNFASVISLLHQNLLVSATIHRTQTLCTIQWDGKSHLEAELNYIPRHIEIRKGDSVVTSGYNAIFPPNVLIGKISSFELEDNDVFYNARISLAVDFTSLNYVYLIKNSLLTEQDSLEQTNLNN